MSGPRTANTVYLTPHGVRTVRHSVRYKGPIIARPPRLAELIDEIADWDIACPDEARALNLKIIPGTSPILVINYRTPPALSRQFGAAVSRQPVHRRFATKLHRGLVSVEPGGALGVIAIRLRAEAAATVLGGRMLDFFDAQIALDDLFRESQVRQLEDILAHAQSSAERFVVVEKFLSVCERPQKVDMATARAAALLRRCPQLRVRQLAARLDISERQLLRNFRREFGVGTKQFARIARIERAMAARARGAAWGDVAYNLGFSDQAHMINEFDEIVGVSPTELIGTQAHFEDRVRS